MKSAEKTPHTGVWGVFSVVFQPKRRRQNRMFSYAESALGRPIFLRAECSLAFLGHSRASVCCEERRKLLYFTLLNEHHLGRESIVQLEQRQTLSQKLVLTQTMRQSLDCLQLSAPELAAARRTVPHLLRNSAAERSFRIRTRNARRARDRLVARRHLLRYGGCAGLHRLSDAGKDVP